MWLNTAVLCLCMLQPTYAGATWDLAHCVMSHCSTHHNINTIAR